MPFGGCIKKQTVVFFSRKEGCEVRDYQTQAHRVEQEMIPTDWMKPSAFWKGGGKPKHFQCDFETYGEVDLGAC